jgi:hypothetical protein
MIKIHWTISHFQSDLGVGLQVWQYVNGAGDGGFCCLVSDYSSAVAKQCGVGAVSLALSNQIYDYIKANNLNSKQPSERCIGQTLTALARISEL